MSTSQNNRGEQPVPPTKSTVVLLLGTIADTTWRMFIPTIGLTVAGAYGDKAFGTKPWLMIAGIALGATIAGLLVVRQLKKVNK
ncbi:MAG: AtpZ/AtpI family protein [Candidatus Saccharimonadales bacterium]